MAATAPTSEPIQSNQSVYLQNSDELKKVLTQFDANGDGKISVSELGNVLTALGTCVPSTDLQKVMEDLDSDHDGFISLEEFAAFCRQSSEAGGASELKDAFDLYDQDQNGLISASELHQVLSSLGMNCSVEDCNRMIGSVDADGDGNVDFEEFKKMMTNSMSNGSNKGSV